MKKVTALAVIIIALFSTITLKAQTTGKGEWAVGLGAEVGAPKGVAKLGAEFTLGATARLQYGLADRVALTLTTGGYHFFPKKNPTTGIRYGSYGEIPVKFGVKGFVIPHAYLIGEIGSASEKEEVGWGKTRLDLSGGAGYVYKHWDLGVHYETFTRHGEPMLGLLGLRLAYSIKL